MTSPFARTGSLAPASIALAFLVSGCVVAGPTGPTVLAVPGQGKTMQAFQEDNAACQQYAGQRIGYGSPGEAANQSTVGSLAIGTGIGAAIGALFGAAAGNAGAGAAIGAGSGLLLGAATSGGYAQASAGNVQQAYDAAYTQCIYARGDSVQNQTSIAQGGPYPPDQHYPNQGYPNQGYADPGYGYPMYRSYPTYPGYPGYYYPGYGYGY